MKMTIEIAFITKHSIPCYTTSNIPVGTHDLIDFRKCHTPSGPAWNHIVLFELRCIEESRLEEIRQKIDLTFKVPKMGLRVTIYTTINYTKCPL